MQFKIPQNVDVDDKIVSFLTMKQLIILVAWGTCVYLFFIFLVKLWVPWGVVGPLIFLLSSLVIAIGFIEINHLSFQRWVALWIASFVIPQKRYWYNWYVWSIYLSAFTQYSSNKKIEKKWKKKESKENIFSTFNENNANKWHNKNNIINSWFELDDEQKDEFYNRFQ